MQSRGFCWIHGPGPKISMPKISIENFIQFAKFSASCLPAAYSLNALFQRLLGSRALVVGMENALMLGMANVLETVLEQHATLMDENLNAVEIARVRGCSANCYRLLRNKQCVWLPIAMTLRSWVVAGSIQQTWEAETRTTCLDDRADALEILIDAAGKIEKSAAESWGFNSSMDSRLQACIAMVQVFAKVVLIMKTLLEDRASLMKMYNVLAQLGCQLKVDLRDCPLDGAPSLRLPYTEAHVTHVRGYMDSFDLVWAMSQDLVLLTGYVYDVLVSCTTE